MTDAQPGALAPPVDGFRERFLKRIQPIHVRFRQQKLQMFFELTGGDPRSASLLDLGGGLGVAREFAPLYDSFRHVVIANLELPEPPGTLGKVVDMMIADGCTLPFRTGAFDWVFSNAAIEHVGDWSRQQRFANEIRRVAAKGFFVATPNRNFPIEPHTLLPFYQFFPPGVQRRLLCISPGYLDQCESVRLLGAKQLARLFPEARVLKIGLPIFPNNLVAFHKR